MHRRGGARHAPSPRSPYHLAALPVPFPTATSLSCLAPCAHQLRVKQSIADATSRLTAGEDPATPAVWVELAAAVAGPGAIELLEGSDADDDLVICRTQEVVETVEAQQADAEAMVAALEPGLCEALKELLAEAGDAVGGREALGAHLHQVRGGRSCKSRPAPPSIVPTPSVITLLAAASRPV